MEKVSRKVWGISAVSIAALLATAVSWAQLELPRPAWYSELTALEIQVVANTQLILGNSWLRLTEQIKKLSAELLINPTDNDLIKRLVVLQLQLRAVNSELK